MPLRIANYNATGSMTQIVSGYAHVANEAAVVLSPTGLAFDAKTDTLYVASTGDNAITPSPTRRSGTPTVARGPWSSTTLPI